MTSLPMKQRLTLFLDGTWNTEDDSTNVRNIYHHVIEGELTEQETTAPEQIRQKRFYDRGVGTGTFEKITGGGFGFADHHDDSIHFRKKIEPFFAVCPLAAAHGPLFAAAPGGYEADTDFHEADV